MIHDPKLDWTISSLFRMDVILEQTSVLLNDWIFLHQSRHRSFKCLIKQLPLAVCEKKFVGLFWDLAAQPHLSFFWHHLRELLIQHTGFHPNVSPSFSFLDYRMLMLVMQPVKHNIQNPHPHTHTHTPSIRPTGWYVGDDWGSCHITSNLIEKSWLKYLANNFENNIIKFSSVKHLLCIVGRSQLWIMRRATFWNDLSVFASDEKNFRPSWYLRV